MDPNGFIHTEYMQCVTATGRLSSRNPNFQNMPRGSTFIIRKAVESRFEGGSILEGDYSQLEFRVAGFLAKDDGIRSDVEAGTDVHNIRQELSGVPDRKPRRTPSSLCMVVLVVLKIRSGTTVPSSKSTTV